MLSVPIAVKGTSVPNSLVTAGLVFAYLDNIFSLPADDIQSKPRMQRRITKARVLTENEYLVMLKEKDRKEKEAEELKKKCKEE